MDSSLSYLQSSQALLLYGLPVLHWWLGGLILTKTITLFPESDWYEIFYISFQVFVPKLSQTCLRRWKRLENDRKVNLTVGDRTNIGTATWNLTAAAQNARKTYENDLRNGGLIHCIICALLTYYITGKIISCWFRLCEVFFCGTSRCQTVADRSRLKTRDFPPNYHGARRDVTPPTCSCVVRIWPGLNKLVTSRMRRNLSLGLGRRAIVK